ncbi:hypothetical protein HZA56_19490 [Candidatus Poribacteria bacterium]|nr:hypothetical protein [Candidatus Poribacteria bacterium]
MTEERFHKIELDRNQARITMDAAYLPVIGQKDYVLLSYYVELLNEVAILGPLDSLDVTVLLYGNPTDEEMTEVERQMKKDWDSLALHQDELMHVGMLSGVLDLAWLSGCIVLAVLKPLVLPLALPYMVFNILQTYARIKKLAVAEKFKECAREIANSMRVVRGTDEAVAARVNPIVELFDKIDGSTQDVYLRLAAKADEQKLKAAQRYYYAQFEDSKPRRGLLQAALSFLKIMFTDEDARRIRIPGRTARKTPLLKQSRQRRSIEFVVLPTRESYEIYLADEFSDGEWFPPSLIPPALHPIAHTVSEGEVEITNVIRVPEELDVEKIRAKLSQSLYITAYSRSKFQAMKLGQLISFEKRQIPIALVVIGVLDMVFGLFKGSFFVSPILLFGAATFGASLLLSRSVKRHFSDIARGFDKIFEDFSHPSLVKDQKLAELNELVKDSSNLFDAYTETFHKALHFGWNGIADIYQSKAVFHQREFKEPGECIMRLER